ncbi:MAG: methylated-DNA--[protein]-cysteine S-methyltransferase [Chloroflexota bacterium]
MPTTVECQHTQPYYLPEMTENLKYITFDTAAGWVGVLASAQGLVRITLPQRSKAGALKLLGDSVSSATSSPDAFQDLKERLKRYFDGQKAAFPDELDLGGATPFQRRVWETTRLIPYGRTRSYSYIAGQIGKPGAARAVGQALGRNPLPIIIPCHRVIARSGRPGGFTGGLEMKISLLHRERAAGIK